MEPSVQNVSLVCSKAKDVFSTIDTSGSGRLSCQDVRFLSLLLHLSVLLSISCLHFPSVELQSH